MMIVLDMMIVWWEEKNTICFPPQDELQDDEEDQQQRTRPSQEPTMAPELNDSAARARLDGEATAGALLDGLVTAGSSEPHEEIPSFNEWAQKRLEEAEKKKSESILCFSLVLGFNSWKIEVCARARVCW